MYLFPGLVETGILEASGLELVWTEMEVHELEEEAQSAPDTGSAIAD